MHISVSRVLLSGMVIVGLCGCSQVSNTYSYGYYSGKSKPVNSSVAPPIITPKPTSSTNTSKHTVAKGETLYSIAFMYGQDVREVASWNNIRAPYTIYPKQVLQITPPQSLQRVTSTPSVNQSTTKITSTPSPVMGIVPSRTQDSKISWQWPTNGKIIGTYVATDTGKKGIDISGQRGQPIYASAEGHVVYSGNGLRGYGNLLIIKHSETLYTAYAHNERLLVTDDANVKKGQRIADMGSSGTDKVMLHFEVRRDGKPVDPLQYLPKRR